jgi:hypothetical protein
MVSFESEKPTWMDGHDQIISLTLATEEFSFDLVEWMARNGGELPSVDLNAFTVSTAFIVKNATPTSWGGKRATIVGGKQMEVEKSEAKVITISDEAIILRLAQEAVRKMKIKDPSIGRFEIELED